MEKAYTPIFLYRESNFKWTYILSGGLLCKQPCERESGSFAYNVEIALGFTWDLNTDFILGLLKWKAPYLGCQRRTCLICYFVNLMSEN